MSGHKTLTISGEAYATLKKRKKGSESFTDVILREFAEGNADRILSVVMGPGFPDSELAENVKRASMTTMTSGERRKGFRARSS
jgi:predicted CopG family antitoxin